MLSPAAIRERVFVELDRLRPIVKGALAPGGSNRFSWLGSELWVDRSRSLVLDFEWVRDKFGCADGDRVPDTFQDQLRMWSPRHASHDAWTMVALLTAFVTGKSDPRVHGGSCSDYLNFAVVQPLVNSAFGSLFWLGLNEELDNRRAASRNLGVGLGAMAYDMADYPTSKNEAAQVRDAQVQFVADKIDATLEQGRWRYASDEEWAKVCAELWHANKGENVFALVADAVAQAE